MGIPLHRFIWEIAGGEVAVRALLLNTFTVAVHCVLLHTSWSCVHEIRFWQQPCISNHPAEQAAVYTCVWGGGAAWHGLFVVCHSTSVRQVGQPAAIIQSSGGLAASLGGGGSGGGGTVLFRLAFRQDTAVEGTTMTLEGRDP